MIKIFEILEVGVADFLLILIVFGYSVAGEAEGGHRPREREEVRKREKQSKI